jgi:mRNA interferase MazF
VQDDRFDGTDSVTVCPFTSVDVEAPLLRMHVPPHETNGLDTSSYVMVDKLTTVRRSSATHRIGALSAAQLVDLERLLLALLGFAD